MTEGGITWRTCMWISEIHASEPQQGVGRVGYLLDPDDNVFGIISAVMSDGTTGMGGGA